jgi:hypothetical protein
MKEQEKLAKLVRYLILGFLTGWGLIFAFILFLVFA